MGTDESVGFEDFLNGKFYSNLPLLKIFFLYILDFEGKGVWLLDFKGFNIWFQINVIISNVDVLLRKIPDDQRFHCFLSIPESPDVDDRHHFYL